MHLSSAPPTQLLAISDGVDGTRQTLKIMRQLVREGKKNPLIRTTAVSITDGLGQKDFLAEIRELHAFVRDKIRYVRDIRGVETLHTPERVLEQRAGDCDDKSILLASLLESLSHPTRLVAVGFRPGQYSHVLVETRVGPHDRPKWLSLETTEPVRAGWQPNGVKSKMVIYN